MVKSLGKINFTLGLSFAKNNLGVFGLFLKQAQPFIPIC
jgi:hypothetical protein